MTCYELKSTTRVVCDMIMFYLDQQPRWKAGVFAVLAVVTHVAATSIAYLSVSEFVTLGYQERMSATLAAALMTRGILAFCMGVDGNTELALAGVQTVALMTNVQFACAFHLPVLRDPRAGVAHHVLRVVEWTFLSFFFTSVAESVSSTSWKGPVARGVMIALSTASGFALPFCGPLAWMFLMGCALVPYAVIAAQRMRAASFVKQTYGTMALDARSLVRARAKATVESIYISMYSTIILVYALAELGAFMGRDVAAWHFVLDCVLDGVATTLYAECVRTLRLEYVRDAMHVERDVEDTKVASSMLASVLGAGVQGATLSRARVCIASLLESMLAPDDARAVLLINPGAQELHSHVDTRLIFHMVSSALRVFWHAGARVIVVLREAEGGRVELVLHAVPEAGVPAPFAAGDDRRAAVACAAALPEGGCTVHMPGFLRVSFSAAGIRPSS